MALPSLYSNGWNKRGRVHPSLDVLLECAHLATSVLSGYSVLFCQSRPGRQAVLDNGNELAFCT